MKFIISLLLLLMVNVVVLAQKANLATQATALQVKMEAAQKVGQCDSALMFARQATAIHLKMGNWKRAIEIEEAAANCFVQAQDWDKAVLAYDTLLINSKKYISKLPIIIAKITHMRGQIQYARGHFNDALLDYKQALDSVKKHDKKDLVATYYTSVGLANYKKSFFYQALEAYEKALAIRLKLVGKKHEQIAQLYNYLGDAYSSLGFYDKSLELLQNGMTMQKELVGADNPSIASFYSSIAFAYKSKGYYDKALEYSLLALNLYKSLAQENTLAMAAIFRLMGDIYVDKGQYDKALEYYDKFLTLEKALVGEQHPDIAKAYSNIGRVFRAKKQNANALNYFQQALVLQEAVLDWQHLDIAATYNDLGDVHTEQAEYDKALAYYEAALNVQEQVSNNDKKNLYNKAKKAAKSHVITYSYNKIGDVYLRAKQFEKAQETFEKNLQLQHEFLGKKHPDLAQTYNYLGDVWFRQGVWEKAMGYYQQALICNIISFSAENTKENPVWAVVQNNYFQYAVLLWTLQQKFRCNFALYQQTHQEDYLQACYLLLSNIDEFSLIVKKNLTDDNEKMAFLAQINATYTDAVPVCLQLAHYQYNDFAEKAFYFAEKNKATLLLGKLTEAKARSFAGLPDSLLAQEQDLARQVAQYQALLLTAEMQDNAAQIPALKTSLFDTKRQYEQLVARFEKDFPQYHELKYNSQIVSIKEIQNLLDTKTALVDYVVADTAIYIFTITNKQFEVQVLKKDDSFHKIITKFRNTIYYQVGAMYVQTAHEIFAQYFPKNLPSKVTHLIIIPDDVLHSVPFDALLTSPFTKNIEDLNYSALPYLIKNYDISYHYSATLFWQNELRQQKEKLTSKQKILENYYIAFAPVFAEGQNMNLAQNIERLYYANETAMKIEEDNFNQFLLNYPEAAAELKKQDAKVTQQLNQRHHKKLIEQQRAFDRNGRYITPLPQTAVEVEAIAKRCMKKKLAAKAYMHQHAKEEAVKSGELGNYQYIHFATHGLVNKVQPELSGLLLAQHANSPEDGLLYIGEIYGLQLNAELVTLSACETALGKLSKGEGVVGFTRAFMYAGAKNVLVSLWKVSDNSTSQLMIGFYDDLLSSQKNNKAESLRLSKLDLIKDKNFNKPYYWSPFVIIGK